MHREMMNTELAIPDLQRRLMVLGYRLDDEAERGLFGEKTAAAVMSFKESTGLGFDDVVDQTTWTALKDASMQMGDRPLYLHMPHFRGRDVSELQGALSSMGFVCAQDSNFGPETEQALRDFQNNMGLGVTGILDEETLVALLRLRHVWQGKRGVSVEGRSLVTARSVTTLETMPVCVFGTDEPTRAIANRIANLARATTVESRFVSASGLSAEPSRDMLLIGLERKAGLPHKTGEIIDAAQKVLPTPVVYVDGRDTSPLELRKAVIAARERQNRLTLVIDTTFYGSEGTVVQRQEIAAHLLDLLCEVLV